MVTRVVMSTAVGVATSSITSSQENSLTTMICPPTATTTVGQVLEEV